MFNLQFPVDKDKLMGVVDVFPYLFLLGFKYPV